MIKKIILLFLVISTSFSCTNVQNALSLQKKQGVDEFLIEKKNPLVLPPDFSKLPVPRDKDEDEIKEKKSIDLSKVLDESKSSNEIKSPSKIEKIISDLLKKK